MHAPTKIAEAAPRNVSLLLIMELLFNDETYVLLADLVVRSVALLRRPTADAAERFRDVPSEPRVIVPRDDRSVLISHDPRAP